MKNRDNLPDETEQKFDNPSATYNFTHGVWFKSALQIPITSAAVATVLYPLEVYETLLKTQSHLTDKILPHVSRKFLGTGPALLASKALMRGFNPQGFANAHKMSFGKNTLLSNHGELQKGIEKSIDGSLEAEGTHHNSFESAGDSIAYSGLASLTIGMGDGLLLNYHRNLRIYNAHGIKPTFQSTEQKFNFWRLGLSTSISKASIGAFWCINMKGLVHQPLGAMFPNYKDTAGLVTASTLATGSLGWCSTNFIDVVNKNKVRQAQFVGRTQIVAQRDIHVLKELVGKEGPIVLFRGCVPGVINASIAYFIVNKVDDNIDAITQWINCKLYVEDAKTYKKNSPTLFSDSKPTKPVVEKSALLEKEEEVSASKPKV